MAEMATVTVFGPALELMKSVKSSEGEMLTKPFLDVCRNVLPVIGMYIWSRGVHLGQFDPTVAQLVL